MVAGVASMMHGGMKVYSGSSRSARSYLEQDRERGQRVDDYYLGEGTGIAQRYG